MLTCSKWQHSDGKHIYLTRSPSYFSTLACHHLLISTKQWGWWECLDLMVAPDERSKNNLSYYSSSYGERERPNFIAITHINLQMWAYGSTGSVGFILWRLRMTKVGTCSGYSSVCSGPRGWQSLEKYIMVNDTVAVTAATNMASITCKQGRWTYLYTHAGADTHTGEILSPTYNGFNESETCKMLMSASMWTFPGDEATLGAIKTAEWKTKLYCQLCHFLPLGVVAANVKWVQDFTAHSDCDGEYFWKLPRQVQNIINCTYIFKSADSIGWSLKMLINARDQNILFTAIYADQCNTNT